MLVKEEKIGVKSIVSIHPTLHPQHLHRRQKLIPDVDFSCLRGKWQLLFVLKVNQFHAQRVLALVRGTEFFKLLDEIRRDTINRDFQGHRLGFLLPDGFEQAHV